jgi:hypothetical protein
MQAALANELEDMHERLAEAVLRLDPEALNWQPAPGLPAVSAVLARAAAEEHRWIAEVLAGTPAGGESESGYQAGRPPLHPLFDLGSAGQFSQLILRNLTPEEWATERRLDGQPVTVAHCVLHVLEELARSLGQIETTAGLWVAHRS